ncbi:MAG TPA: hypothetical protein P5213_02985 [Rectinema sp.]|nr:hypothetical protein [Rectinema sp.]
MEMTSMSPDIVKMVSAIIEVIEDNHGYTVDEIDYEDGSLTISFSD